MRRVLEGTFGLLLLAPALWALDDTQGANEPATPPTQGKTPAEQYQAIVEEVEKEQKQFDEAYVKATPEEREKLEYPSPKKYAERMLRIAEKNPKDPAAIDALVWVVLNAEGSEEGKKAVVVLLRDHI